MNEDSSALSVINELLACSEETSRRVSSVGDPDQPAVTSTDIQQILDAIDGFIESAFSGFEAHPDLTDFFRNMITLAGEQKLSLLSNVRDAILLGRCQNPNETLKLIRAHAV